MGEPSPGTLPPVRESEERLNDHLDSWKEIATYLNRDVTTVQRWEKREGMPVHRHVHDKRGSVYALTEELDLWMQSRRLPGPVAEDQPEVETPAQTPAIDPAQQIRPAPRTARLLLSLAAALCVCLLIAVWLMFRHRTPDAAAPRIGSLAVLPLKNLSGDPAQEYLADGMTEEVIGRLSMIHGLRVISRTSVMQLKDTKLLAPEIAAKLGVDALVEGSVIREGNRIRVHAQLIRAPNDEHFWSETYDRELGDALALESDVAESIARRVEVTVTGEERARLVVAREVSPAVYESYLRGRGVRGNSRAEIEKSVTYFEEAIKNDPAFAPAYAGLAVAYSRLGTVEVGAMPPTEARQKVINAARKALELDPNLAEAHAQLAFVYMQRWQWRDAEVEYRRALELNPNDAAAYRGFGGGWLMLQGRFDEALAMSRRALELDPLGGIGTELGWVLFHARRYDEAIRELRNVVAVHPDRATALNVLGQVLIFKGDSEEAISLLEKTHAMTNSSPGSILWLAVAYAHAGRRTEAVHLIDELKLRQKTTYVSPAAFVYPYLALGDYDQAFAWLERAYREQSNILMFLRVGPFFDPVRNDPRFKDLVRRVGLN
jgi:TolB-like protein/Tfp pilus assembly protein PilF